LSHANPKVRRAAANALGNFRDEDSAAALIGAAQGDESYFVRGAALASLGKTRDPRAFDVLARAVKEHTWNSTVEAGAVHGLSELADARGAPLVLEAMRAENDEGLRRAAVHAIGRFGQLVDSERTRAVAAVEERLDDELLLVQLSAIAAAEGLGDARLLTALDRLSYAAADGRVRRDAMEAAIRVREASKVPAAVSAMRGDIDGLREEHQKLREKIETLSRP
jgi:HEAT repeat protein